MNAHTRSQRGGVSRPAIVGAAGTAGRRFIATVALMLPASMLGAQTPKVYYACYVPSSGTVYRIKEANTPQECGSSSKKGQQTQHIEFNWTDGAGADHGALAGLGDDDHSQYLLADGVRNSVNGFAVTGATGVGVIPATGAGTRLMWYPKKAAFRAGGVNEYGAWDDAKIGSYSAVIGYNGIASGFGAVALGIGSGAIGERSIALTGGLASGFESLAVVGHASGAYAVAIGQVTQASGNHSMALGSSASTNGKTGAFVWGDAAVGVPTVSAAADNQFVVRATRFWFGNTSNVTATTDRYLETSTGAFLSSGGTWTNSSDSTKKTAFHDVSGDSVLARLAAMPIRTWRYRDEDSTVRHMGPTAQDFRAAFSLGDSDKAIATVDADGVSLAAIQALLQRTERLARENEALARTNAELRSNLAVLEDRLVNLETALSQLALRSTSSTSQR